MLKGRHAGSALAPGAQTLEAVLHQMPQPTLLSDCAGKLAFANAAGLNALSQGDGLRLERGLINTPHEDSESLREAIAKACHSSAPRAEAVLVRRTQRPPLLISVAPVREADGSRWALLLINSVDSLGEEVLDRLQRLFRLSRTEAKIAVAITTGSSVGHIARERGVAEGTVRTQLKSLAAKLGCHRQAEIAVLVKTIAQTGTGTTA